MQEVGPCSTRLWWWKSHAAMPRIWDFVYWLDHIQSYCCDGGGSHCPDVWLGCAEHLLPALTKFCLPLSPQKTQNGTKKRNKNKAEKKRNKKQARLHFHNSKPHKAELQLDSLLPLKFFSIATIVRYIPELVVLEYVVVFHFFIFDYLFCLLGFGLQQNTIFVVVQSINYFSIYF